MSIKAMTLVWQYAEAKGSELLLLLAIADYANDQLANAFPAIDTLAVKTRLTPRNVQLLIRKLAKTGQLEIEEGAGPRGAHRYRLHLNAPEHVLNIRKCQGCGAIAELHEHHIIPRSQGGGDQPENLVTLCATCHKKRHPKGWLARAKKGEDISPENISGRNGAHAGGENQRIAGVIPAAPDPSSNHQEPSEDHKQESKEGIPTPTEQQIDWKRTQLRRLVGDLEERRMYLHIAQIRETPGQILAALESAHYNLTRERRR